MKNYSVFFVWAFLLIGCVATKTPPGAGSFDGARADKLRVSAVVFREMIERSGSQECLIGLSPADFEQVSTLLQHERMSVHFRQAQKGDFERGQTIVTMTVDNIDGVNASATGAYSSKAGFSQFEYKLKKSGEIWKISSVVLIAAS